MSLNLDSYLGTHATAMIVRSKRATVLANNLANADTPGYKAQDLSFKNILNKQSDNQISLSGNNKSHIGTLQSATLSPTVMYRVPTQTSQDGNTVQTDIEKSAFTENAIRYQASLQFTQSRVSGLIKAIRGE